MNILDSIKKKITDGASQIARHNYIYVPPCPCCGSVQTGRFVKAKLFPKDNDWIMEESYKNGEIVLLAPEIGEENAFCWNCDYRWHANIQNVWLTTEDWLKEAKDRNTALLYEAYENQNEDQKRDNRRFKALDKVGGFFGRR